MVIFKLHLFILLFCRHFQHLRRTAAATKIQASFRGFQQRKRFQSIQKSVVGLQALARGQAARRRHFAQVRHQKAIIIQKHVRGWLARKRYASILGKIVYLQSCWRRWKARKELKALKVGRCEVPPLSYFAIVIFFGRYRYKLGMSIISSR